LVPAIILGLDIGGTLAKMFHEDLKTIQSEEYIRTARAKGLSDARIVMRHMVPNAVAVVLALMGIIFAGVLSGTITLEVVFGLPGIGSLTLGAMQGRDYPTVQAVVIWLGLVVVAANLLTDTLQRLIDPRLRR
jgi:peptide/nickel transport system permease protein